MHMKRVVAAWIWVLIFGKKTMCLAVVCTTHVLAMPLLAVVKEVQAVLYNEHSADLDFR